ncbi:penicillin-binding protein 1A [Pandoraea terrae]|uniref:penicillin-binding protein 1A n=1 Tax=Pandoraea terrae TaxID=1537710 RepID=UPI003B83685F
MTAHGARRDRGFAVLALLITLIGGMAVIGALLLAYAMIVMRPNLPPLDVITDYRPKVPLRVYTADHVLIGEFGEERRSLVRIDQIPDVMKKAVLAIEDYRFYEHGGVDFIGILRAGVSDVLHGGKGQGASTITMQVARNFFLSRQKTYSRKLYEMLLAYKIESALSKDQILELYMNQIFLGQRAYGFASAARIYFGKDLKDVTLAEAAMLAGLPKAPSAYNPITNPKRAKIRQEYILKRMLDLGYISKNQYDDALREPMRTRTAGNEYNVHAEYVAEMVRQAVYDQYKDDTYTRGFTVITTLDSKKQQAAYEAVRAGVLDYERRHAYRGPEGTVELPAAMPDRQQAIEDALLDHPDNGDLAAAVVVAVSASQITAVPLNGDTITISGEGIGFAAPALSSKAPQNLRIQPGAIIRIMKDAKGKWRVSQLPEVQGALVSLSPDDGAIRAMIGGFDFNQSKFNRVTQAWRQPGSAFKPIVYSAALEKGVSPATIVNDAPLNLSPSQTGGQPWDPKDDDAFSGPMTVRAGLERSKNLVAIRLLQFAGTEYTQEYAARFGFDPDKVPPYLPMALGAGQTTPLQLAGAYAVFANGGYRVAPYLIGQIQDARGNVLSKATPVIAGVNAARAISAPNAYLMNSLLMSVAQHGTGAGTNALRRTDLAGKTGTTNDAFDGWFAGYQHTLVAVAWLGFDQPKTLGSREFGAQLALPVWTKYMGAALAGVPQEQMAMPEGVSVVNGELYLSDKLPGSGFVASIGVDDSPGFSLPFFGSSASPSAPAPAAAQPPSPGGVDIREKARILDMFKHP